MANFKFRKKVFTRLQAYWWNYNLFLDAIMLPDTFKPHWKSKQKTKENYLCPKLFVTKNEFRNIENYFYRILLIIKIFQAKTKIILWTPFRTKLFNQNLLCLGNGHVKTNHIITRTKQDGQKIGIMVVWREVLDRAHSVLVLRHQIIFSSLTICLDSSHPWSI